MHLEGSELDADGMLVIEVRVGSEGSLGEEYGCSGQGIVRGWIGILLRGCGYWYLKGSLDIRSSKNKSRSREWNQK